MLLRLARPLLLCAAAWTGALTAQAPAQTSALDLTLAPSPALRCLNTGPAMEPEYPFAPWKKGEGGRVLVEMSFTGRTLAPAVKVIENTGDPELATAVRAHVREFRVPCLEDAQIPLRLQQEYVFTPDQRRAQWTTPADLDDPVRREQLACVAATDGSKHPTYPDWARRIEAEGNVLAVMKFTAPDQPPEAVLHYHSRTTRELSASVEAWVQRLRMPCLKAAPVSASYTFMFRMEGKPPVGFRNISFMQFLRTVKGLDKQRASFDTQAMGCPFDIRLRYFQPYLPNSVGQLGETDSRRQPLLDWLSTLTLDINGRAMDAAIGDSATLTVPCLKLQLQPEEKTS
jgi:hypothetical protein